MKFAYLIKGGTVVDGTGAPAYQVDVRIGDGLIVEIAPNLAPFPRERVIDAVGCHVTPGFVELHNHWDGAIWWSPTMDPLPGYGVTTSVNGNCGFSAAPVNDDPAIRREIVDIFNFFEDIPEAAMLQLMPWTWRKWSEYQDVLNASLRLPVNFASYCGHIPLRLATMGLDAWERAARTDAADPGKRRSDFRPRRRQRQVSGRIHRTSSRPVGGGGSIPQPQQPVCGTKKIHKGS